MSDWQLVNSERTATFCPDFVWAIRPTVHIYCRDCSDELSFLIRDMSYYSTQIEKFCSNLFEQFYCVVIGDSPIFMAIFCEFFSAKKLWQMKEINRIHFFLKNPKIVLVLFITNEKTGYSSFFKKRKENTCFDELWQ